MITLTNSEARRFLLAYQRLLPPRQGSGKAGILEYIRQVHCIQFDPLNMVGQNPHLVLQARISDYRPQMLNELLYQERRLLDGWDKVMAIYPTEDWPWFERRRQYYRAALEHSSEGIRQVSPHILAEIERRGPLSSLDLDFNHTVDWAWGPTRAARATLESLYYAGDLVIHHKINTRKVYDLTTRHISAELLAAPDANLTDLDYQDWYVHRRIGSVGLLWSRGAESWLGVPANSIQRQESFKRLQARGKVIQVTVEDGAVPFYMRSQDWPLLEQSLADEALPLQASFIAPLDNLIWNRQMIERLFSFEYRWEVYTPQVKRKYGYYVLPVLYGDRFIARVEPVFEKRTRNLVIKNWWWEAGEVPDEPLMAALVVCFERFATYLNAKSIQLGDNQVESPEVKQLVSRLCEASC